MSPYKDIEKQRAYDRKRAPKRKQYFSQYQKTRYERYKNDPEMKAKRKQRANEYYLLNREELLAKAKTKQRSKYLSKQTPEYFRQYWYVNRERYKQQVYKSRKENPEKYRAQQTAEGQVKLKDTCELCGSTKSLQRHHPNYTQRLNVITICRSCHAKLHPRSKNRC